MKQDKTSQAERLFRSFGDLDPDMIRDAQQYRPLRHRKKPGIQRVLAVALITTLMLTLVTLTVFAASPTLRGIINLPFLDQNARKESVPEGWIGIYTVSDLDEIRQNLDGKYILMNDLTFTEADGSFTPIGTQQTPFTGQFDGNGYVIRNLSIDTTLTPPPVIDGETSYQDATRPFSYHDTTQTNYVGLFGFCGYSQFETNTNLDRDLNDFYFPYLTDDRPYRGMICNLGVEDAHVKVSNVANARIGVIAGQGSYVASCYVENCTLEVTGYEPLAERAPLRLRMGGIAGNVQVMDSCYARKATLTVTDTADLYSDIKYAIGMSAPEQATVFMGGLVGDAYTMVTSFAEDCELSCDYANHHQLDIRDPLSLGYDHPAYLGELYGHVHRLPNVMNYSTFEDVKVAMFRAVCGLTEEEPLPDDWDRSGNLGNDKNRFYYWVFRSYFIRKPIKDTADYYGVDPDQINPSLFTGDFTWETEAYILDRIVGMDGLIRAENVALHYLGEDRLTELVSIDNLKVGPIHCYVLSPYQETYKESDLDGFNFKTIWEMKDGRPVLRIFQ